MSGVWTKVFVTVVLVFLPEWIWLTQLAHAELGSASLNEGEPLSGWAVAVAVGFQHTCALTTSDGVKCWGNNQYGQLGDGTTEHRLTPVDVTGLTSGVQAIAAASNYTCALMSAGGVKCWGENSYGRLGDGTTIDRLTPVNVQGFEEAGLALAAGGHTCVAPARGGIKCWGANFSGELGDGTTINRLMPVDVVDFSGQTRQLDVGLNHTCAVNGQGDALCWGYNGYGQLGDGTGTNRLTPTSVLGLASGARAISAGTFHTCAVTAGGSAKCWGFNSDGQIGNGAGYSLYTSPVDVAGLQSSVTSIYASNNYSCAILSDASIHCWGRNANGQLGDGSRQNRLVPVEVTSMQARAVGAALESLHTCAVTDAGGVKCWGYNNYGQLGDGSTTERPTPADVLVYNCASVNEIPEGECNALVGLRLSTIERGRSWKNSTGWLRNATPCSWYGVTCALGHVIGLNLANNDMGGSLPPELGGLAALTDLDLSGNSLQGDLPVEIGGLAALETLNLSRNQFTGPLPLEWGNLAALRVLDLSQSGARGEFPAAWGGLKALQQLTLYRVGGVYGPLPSELGELTALRSLDLSYNGFDALPETLGQLCSLESLHLNNNNFSGPLPATLGNLKALRFLSVYSNRFSGSIPPELGQLKALQTLDLGRNAFTGRLPPELGGLDGLIGMYLQENLLTGALPSELGRLKNLQVLDLAYNQLTGTIPLELGTLPALVNLYLNDNQLGGPIPAELGALQALRREDGNASSSSRASADPEVVIDRPPTPPCCGYIDLSSNLLTGSIPAELTRLSGLRSLDLAGNQLAGPVPSGLVELPDYWANFGHNMLAVSEYPNIAATQTVPPTDFHIVCTTKAVTLTWTPISYTGDVGYYEISYARTLDGAFTVVGNTSNKTADNYVVAAPMIDPAPYFRIRTFTQEHSFVTDDWWGGRSYRQQSDLWSEYSSPVSCAAARRIRIFAPVIWK